MTVRMLRGSIFVEAGVMLSMRGGTRLGPYSWTALTILESPSNVNGIVMSTAIFPVLAAAADESRYSGRSLLSASSRIRSRLMSSQVFGPDGFFTRGETGSELVVVSFFILASLGNDDDGSAAQVGASSS